MPIGCFVAHRQAVQPPTEGLHQAGFDPVLIDENQTGWIDAALIEPPAFAFKCDVSPRRSLGRVVFLMLTPSAQKNRDNMPGPDRTSCTSRNGAHIASSVKLYSAFIIANNHSRHLIVLLPSTGIFRYTTATSAVT